MERRGVTGRAERVRGLGQQPRPDEPLLVEREGGERVAGEVVERRARRLRIAGRQLDVGQDAAPDRVRGVLGGGPPHELRDLVEPALRAPEHVQLEPVGDLGVPALGALAERAGVRDELPGLVEAALEQRDEGVVHGDEPRLRGLAQLARDPRHLREVRPRARQVAELDARVGALLEPFEDALGLAGGRRDLDAARPRARAGAGCGRGSGGRGCSPGRRRRASTGRRSGARSRAPRGSGRRGARRRNRASRSGPPASRASSRTRRVLSSSPSAAIARSSSGTSRSSSRETSQLNPPP